MEDFYGFEVLFPSSIYLVFFILPYEIFTLLQIVRTGSGANQASCLMGAGVLSPGECEAAGA